MAILLRVLITYVQNGVYGMRYDLRDLLMFQEFFFLRF